MSTRADILRGAYRKLDGLPMSFGLPSYDPDMTDTDLDKYLGGDLNDALREMRISDVGNVVGMSLDELHVENRVVYYALKRFRNSSSVFFKFSTAVDGKTVDKSMIPKMLMQIINDYDNEYKSYKSAGCGSVWHRGEV